MENDEERWNQFVLQQEQAGPFHWFGWKKAIEKAYRHATYYLIAEDEQDRVLGVLPLIQIRPPFLKGCLVSLPFCDYAGGLAWDRGISDALMRRALELADSLGTVLEIRCAQADRSAENTIQLNVSSHKVRMILELPNSAEALWDSFKPKLKSQVRRPQKDGMEFKLGSVELVKPFYEVFSRNMHELGSPVHSKKLLVSVVEALGKKAQVGIIFSGKIPVAGGLMLEFRDKVTIPWASALKTYNKSSPNMLLYWGFLQYASENGYKWFDFGRSTPGEGTFRFKEQWGAIPIPLSWYSSGNPEKQQLNHGKFRRVGERMWTLLPLFAANALGPLARKYIPL